jgi:ubiquinone/menaquinone biosynthesis C-methylase UbiE
VSSETPPVVQPVDLPYEPFWQAEEFVAVNRLLVESLLSCPHRRVVDLACGAGAVIELVLEVLSPHEEDAPPNCHVIGIDNSAESLELARSRLAAKGPASQLLLIKGSAEFLPLCSATVDLVTMGNAIHLLTDPEPLMREVLRTLRTGGVFAFNTSFYAGTFVEGTERFYTEWLKQALTRISSLDYMAPGGGTGGIARTHRRTRPAFSHRWLSQAEYGTLLYAAGFEAVRMREHTIALSQHSFETAGAYAGLAGVLLSGYSTQIASEALVKAAGPAMAEAGMAQVPRRWLEVVAEKP